MKKIRVNGSEYDGSIIVTIQGEEFSGPSSISYDDKVERAKTYGATGRRRKPRGRTLGKYTPGDPVMKGPKKGMKEIADKLAALGGGNIAFPEFLVTVSYIDNLGQSVTDMLEETCVSSRKTEVDTTGTDAVVEEWGLDIMGIKWGGNQTLYNQI